MKIVVSPLKAFSDNNSNVVQNFGLTINKLEHCRIRTKANYRDFLLSLQFTPNYCRKCHCVVKGKINASFILVICKILLILSHPLKGHLILAFFLFINIIFIFFNTCFGACTVRQKA